MKYFNNGPIYIRQSKDLTDVWSDTVIHIGLSYFRLWHNRFELILERDQLLFNFKIGFVGGRFLRLRFGFNIDVSKDTDRR